MDLNTTSDAELLSAYLKGNSNAFRLLEKRYRKPLFAWLIASLGNRSDAEELYQDIWLKIIKKADRFKNVSFKAWLWKIARNRVIDFRRKKRPDLTLDTNSSIDEQPLVEKLISNDKRPAESTEINEMAQKIMMFVDQLPERQREVFFMRMQANLSFKEIAANLDIPLNTALGRMHDALHKVKKQILQMEEI